MLRRLFFILACISALTSDAQTSLQDTLHGTVSQWDHLQQLGSAPAQRRIVLAGETHDLSGLNVLALTLPANGASSDANRAENPSNRLLIVKEGTITVYAGGKDKVLGPGGVGLFAANDQFDLRNTGKTDATFYIFLIRSRSDGNKNTGQNHASPFLLDWPEMPVKTTARGAGRQIFDRPVTGLRRIDMHATTLDSGQISHPPHVHRAEEIILMRSGNVQVFIGGKYYDAKGGDLIFFPSGVPHNIANNGNGPCEYFALQWEP
ncbi:MAG TPA: cupin domain-containing protein [Puia sp.]|nr:cupin domain-containing protein [Puia sp.]